ncbi:hypothetical protein PspLS_03259 [Pyricularia sp. CBS 133598]|nr:hypothetical protein PspLS_03259 [Pyricularia sp. CBS 133598]
MFSSAFALNGCREVVYSFITLFLLLPRSVAGQQQANGSESPELRCESCTDTTVGSLKLDRKWSTNSADFQLTPISVPSQYRSRFFGGFAAWPQENTKDPSKSAVYFWGGGPSNESSGAAQDPPPPLIEFTPSRESKPQPDRWVYGQDNAWTSAKGPDPSLGITPTSAGSWTTCDGVGLLLSGRLARAGRLDASPGLVAYDFKTVAWANRSSAASGFGPAGGGDAQVVPGTHVDGTAVCLDGLGTDGRGLVIFLGGTQRGRSGVSQNMPMDRVYMYDVAADVFHSQLASGGVNIPLPRSSFCAVATKGSGSGPSSSYEIFVFGGNRAGGGMSDADVYVLTVPGFRWFKRQTSEEETRYMHACAVAGRGRRQMITVGGLKGAASTFFYPSKFVSVLDMTEMQWKDEYDPEMPAYEPPLMVKQWYAEGGLDKVNWEDDKTRKLFPQFSSTTPAPGTPGTPDPTDTSAVPVAAIAGGIAGGVVLLLAICALAFMLRRRRRQAKQDPIKQERHLDATTTSAGDGKHGPEKPMLDSRPVHEMAHDGSAGWGGKVAPVEVSGTGRVAGELHGGSVPVEMQGVDVPIEMPHGSPKQQQQYFWVYELPASSPGPPWNGRGTGPGRQA